MVRLCKIKYNQKVKLNDFKIKKELNLFINLNIMYLLIRFYKKYIFTDNLSFNFYYDIFQSIT